MVFRAHFYWRMIWVGALLGQSPTSGLVPLPQVVLAQFLNEEPSKISFFLI